MRTAQSLTSSTPLSRLVVCARTTSTPAAALLAWSAMRAASVRMVATMTTTTTITMNASEKPMYQSVYVAARVAIDLLVTPVVRGQQVHEHRAVDRVGMTRDGVLTVGDAHIGQNAV